MRFQVPPRISHPSVCAAHSVPPEHLINMHCGRLLRRLRHSSQPGLAMYSIEYVSCQTRTRWAPWACPAKRTRWLYLTILVAILPPRPTERVSGLAPFPIRHKYAALI